MRALALLVAGLTVTACSYEPHPEAPPRELMAREDAILGGVTNFGDPELFFVSARTGPTSGYSCSSTLIGTRTLLTAAHCVEKADDGGIPVVRFSNKPRALDARSDAGEVFTAIQQKRHPDFNDNKLTHDVGAYQLDRPPPVKPKEWNRMTNLDGQIAKDVRAAGYGLTGDVTGSGIKRTVSTPLLGVDTAVITFGGRGVNGICNGDSGGPAFMTFPDGKERVTGVHSYTRTDCGDGASVRVDQEQAKIDEWLALYEGAQCGDDGLCKGGCAPADNDCLCPKDGVCGGTCPALERDPDCMESCVSNRVCSVAACGTADPDCSPVGGDCNDDSQCGSRSCINDPQHPNWYCTRSCVAPAECPAGFDCTNARCVKKQQPSAALGAACTAGETFCTDGTICNAAPSMAGTCERPCLVTADCPGQYCTSTDGGFGICANQVTVPYLKSQYPAAAGCQAAPGATALAAMGALLAVALQRARRRR